MDGSLILERTPNESITIYDGDSKIVVLICQIRSQNRVKLRITAPKKFTIHRTEIYNKIVKQSNREAVTGPAESTPADGREQADRRADGIRERETGKNENEKQKGTAI